MTTADEAAAHLRAVLDLLDAGGERCGCDGPDNPHEPSDFLGYVSRDGGEHREIRAEWIRALLDERAHFVQAHADAKQALANRADEPPPTHPPGSADYWKTRAENAWQREDDRVMLDLEFSLLCECHDGDA